MKKFFKITGLVLVILLVVIQFVGPERTNPVAAPEQSIHAQVQVPADVRAIVERSCIDCHSNDTRWPWYSRVAPVSWLVIDHVNHGRRHMNFNEWNTHREHWTEGFDTPALLQSMCNEVTHQAMPLPSYTRMHRSAPLSPAEVKTLCAWTEAERTRLAQTQPTP
ncbi:MAG TPA: heme-binding domain-containing protein [Candidatus Acidoferrales bacterium]